MTVKDVAAVLRRLDEHLSDRPGASGQHSFHGYRNCTPSSLIRSMLRYR